MYVRVAEPVIHSKSKNVLAAAAGTLLVILVTGPNLMHLMATGTHARWMTML
jgi:hypothetical protein